MSLRDWLPFCDPDNGLTAKEERQYNERYDDKVKRLRAQGPEGKRAAQRFINDEHAKYQAWRKAAKAREARSRRR